MSHLPKVLIISTDQFGYNDYFLYYAEYLSKYFQVDYWCRDENKKRVVYTGNDIVYFENAKGRLRLLWFSVKIGLKLRSGNYDFILFRGFKLAFISKIISGKKAAFDIRTVGVGDTYLKRLFHDLIIRFNTFFFDIVFTISASITKHLKVNPGKVVIVPIGGEVNVDRSRERLSELRFLYIGTLNGRRIQDTIEGLSLFCNRHADQVVTYNIVGMGNKMAEAEIDRAIGISPSNLEVFRRGYVSPDNIQKYFEEHYIGVSYVPMTRWYLLQPPTKTFEYLLAGMVVIATALPLNKEIIDDRNGVIINDNPESFSSGVERIYNNMESYNMDLIGKSSQKYSWKEIIEDQLATFIMDSINS